MTATGEPAELIRVMVVDDHPVWRSGIRTDLEQTGVGTVVAEASDGGEAIDVARDAMPEVVLMDLNLPTVGGVEATRRIVEESPHTKVLVLSASAEEFDVLEAVKAGASGYLLKSATTAEVADAVRRVRAGEPVFTPSLAGLVLGEFRRIATRTRRSPSSRPGRARSSCWWRRDTPTGRLPRSSSSRSRPSRTTSRTSCRSSSSRSATS